MAEPELFPTLMRKLTDRDADAEAAVFERYAGRLIGLARKHLEERVRAKLDADDIAQSAFRTFFRRAREGQFDLASEDALWALLAEIAVRKCGKWNRHFRTRKRSAAREVPPAEERDVAATATEPGPAEAAALADLVDNLLRGLGDRKRLVCELRLQGYAVAEIAAQARCSEAAVFRDLNHIKERLETLLNADAGSDDDAADSWQALVNEQRPAEAARRAELVEKLLAGFEGRERDIVRLCLQGHTAAKVKTEVSCSERTVQRVLERAIKRLKRLRTDEGDHSW